MHQTNDRFWKHLLHFIDEGKVIPLIGPELCSVNEGGQDVALHTWLAQRLAEELNLPYEKTAHGDDLNHLVARHVAKTGERDSLYTDISILLRDAKLQPSPALLALASIPQFKRFVSLSFDNLLENALQQSRPGQAIERLVFLPNQKCDLPDAGNSAAPSQTLIFHLLGHMPGRREFVICDDDHLEFVHALQDKQRQPSNLFAAMREHHLLILGCRFSDWLARFFLRAMRNTNFSQPSKNTNYLIGQHIGEDEKLKSYLQYFSADHEIIAQPAADFALELARRWHQAHPAQVQTSPPPPSTAPNLPPEYGAAFISFSSKNRSVVEQMARQLTESGVEVWLDSKDLQAGDAWELKIERAIARCALFLAVISQESLDRDQRDRYFWFEWNTAHERARHHAPDLEFIIPVIIDNTDPYDLRDVVPKTFSDKQGICLPGGNITPEFAQRLQVLQRDYRRRKGQ